MDSNQEGYLRQWVAEQVTPSPPEPVGWAQDNVIFPGSARGEQFDISVTPWIREPLYRACIGIWTPTPEWVEEHEKEFDNIMTVSRINTLMKPVQSGGSACGEVFLLYCLKFAHGFLQYNWSKDDRAKERWDSRIDATIRACKPIAQLISNLDDRHDSGSMEIDFKRIFFRMQGVWVADNLDSDSITVQINEEIHSWKPGFLQKARARTTAVDNPKTLDISNAGNAGDQLAKAYDSGTQQRWVNKCPGCGKFHAMQTRFDKKRPDLGGLRYDGDKARRDYGYDYNVIKDTLRYQMPCGYIVLNGQRERKALSIAGQYSLPRDGANLEHRSYTYDAVTVDYIDWVTLVQEKHQALAALRLGDPEPWRRYRTERECVSHDKNDAPIDGSYTVLTQDFKLSREGLTGPKLRFYSLDRQQGSKARNEFPHWWLVIRDFQIWVDPETRNAKLRSRLVFEGKVDTDEEVIKILDEHKCLRHHGVADSGDDTTHVYLFCLKYGINAIKGGKSSDFYSHPNGARRVYSPERPLHTMLNREPCFPYLKAPKKNDPGIPDPREPLFWLYSKVGIRERFHWMRTSTMFETPSDVSEEYQAHLDAEERIVRHHPTTNEEIPTWVQKRSRNDLFVCECYISMQVDQAGLIMQEITKMQLNAVTTTAYDTRTTSDSDAPVSGEGFNNDSNESE